MNVDTVVSAVAALLRRFMLQSSIETATDERFPPTILVEGDGCSANCLGRRSESLEPRVTVPRRTA